MSSLFEQMMEEREPLFPRQFLPMLNELRTDIVENKGNFEITMDMPGFSKEDVQINIKNQNLIVSAKRETSNDDNSKNYIIRERSTNTVSRSFHIKSLKPENVKASFKDGVLNIVVEKPDPKEEMTKINID